MLETKSRKKLASTKDILRTLRFVNIFGKPSDFEENIHLTFQNGQSLNANVSISDKNSLSHAERIRAEALIAQQRQRFI